MQLITGDVLSRCKTVEYAPPRNDYSEVTARSYRVGGSVALVTFGTPVVSVPSLSWHVQHTLRFQQNQMELIPE